MVTLKDDDGYIKGESSCICILRWASSLASAYPVKSVIRVSSGGTANADAACVGLEESVQRWKAHGSEQ